MTMKQVFRILPVVQKSQHILHIPNYHRNKQAISNSLKQS